MKVHFLRAGATRSLCGKSIYSAAHYGSSTLVFSVKHVEVTCLACRGKAGREAEDAIRRQQLKDRHDAIVTQTPLVHFLRNTVNVRTLCGLGNGSSMNATNYNREAVTCPSCRAQLAQGGR